MSPLSSPRRSRTVNRTPSPHHIRSSPLDFEWRLLHVSSESEQELDKAYIGPVGVGVNAIDFYSEPVDPAKIPIEDVLGVTVLVLTGSYKDQEFVRLAYYQNTAYDNEEMNESPPQEIVFDRLIRDIKTGPRVARFQIRWSVILLFPLRLY